MSMAATATSPSPAARPRCCSGSTNRPPRPRTIRPGTTCSSRQSPISSWAHSCCLPVSGCGNRHRSGHHRLLHRHTRHPAIGLVPVAGLCGGGARRRRSDRQAAGLQRHDAQVRRISWVRGVGRPALAHSGLLVPLPNADRPPSFKQNIRTSCQGTKDSDFLPASNPGSGLRFTAVGRPKRSAPESTPSISYIWRTRGLRQDPAPPVKPTQIRRENGSGD